MPIYTIANLQTSSQADYLLKFDNTWVLTAPAGQPVPQPSGTPLGAANGNWAGVPAVNFINIMDSQSNTIDVLENVANGDPTAPSVGSSGATQSGDQWTRQS